MNMNGISDGKKRTDMVSLKSEILKMVKLLALINIFIICVIPLGSSLQHNCNIDRGFSLRKENSNFLFRYLYIL